MEEKTSHKECRSCTQTLPTSLFYKRKSNKDGLYSYCKACTDAKGRMWRANNPNWAEHKRQYDKDRVARLAVEISEKNKLRYKVTREQKIANAAAWAKANPEKRKAIAQNYKYRRRSLERDGINGRDLAKWRAEQCDVCYWCGDDKATIYTVDHFYPLARGGKHQIENLVICCKSCNLRKNAKDPYEFAKEIGRLDILENGNG